MAFIELDHTSSGVQIAAALARDARTAAIVNIAGGTRKSDLYSVVFAGANDRLARLGSDIRLTRADVKRAVIARVYGGGFGTSDDAFAKATGLALSDETRSLFRALSDAIRDEMSGVVTVQRYFAYIVRKLAAAGHDSISLTLANESVYVCQFAPEVKTLPMFDVSYIHDDNTERKAQFVGVEYRTGELDLSATAKSVCASFIQSFDAMLLARVQVRLYESGIRFFAKHDAYLIDASDRAALTRFVQEEFFALFTPDWLGRTRRDLSERYGIEFDSFAAYGDYDVSAVLSSDFLISE
jgi:DNA-directed RNA polymerase